MTELVQTASPNRTKERPPPDEHTLRRLVEEMKEFYRDDDKAIEDTRAVVEFRDDVAIDDAYMSTGFVMRDPTATDEVLRVGTLLTANRPKLQVTAQTAAKNAQKNAGKREKASEAMLLDEASPKGSKTYVRLGMSIAQDGAAVSSLVWLPDTWEGRYGATLDKFEDDEGYPFKRGAKSREEKHKAAIEEEKKKAPFPFLWEYHDPKTVYPIPFGQEVGGVLVVTEHPLWATLREHDLSLTAKGEICPNHLGAPEPEKQRKRGASMRVTKVAHWTKTHVSYWLQNDKSTHKLDSWRHGYGFIPFVFTYGYQLPHWTNRKVGAGAAWVMMPSVKYATYLKTLHANFAASSIAPSFQRQRPEGADPVRRADNKPTDKEKVLPSTIYNLAPGESIAAFPQAQSNPHIREQIEMNAGHIAQLRGPQATGNLSDAENGFAIQSVLSEYRVKLSPFIVGLQDHLTQTTENLWRLIRTKAQEPVWVYRRGGDDAGYISLGPSDLEDNVAQEWDIAPETPSAAIIERRYHTEGIQAGLESEEMAIQAEGNNVDEVREGRLRDAMWKDPRFLEMARAEMLAEYNAGDLEARFFQITQAVETGQVQPQQGGGLQGEGNPSIPDFGALAMSPGGQGAAPMQAMGPISGVGPGATVPTQAATAAVQDLGQ